MQKLTTEEFVNRAIKIHGDKYDYSKVEYTLAKNKVKIICEDHGVFEQKANGHLNGKGCKYCSQNVKLSNEEFIKKAKKIHGNKYDYSKVEYKNAFKKVKIICDIHGIFEQSPDNHANGKKGCYKCRSTSYVNSRKLTTEEFANRAKKIHGDKYNYSKVDYVNSKTKVKIICEEHGIFKQIPNDHLNGNGCRKCSLKKIRLTTKEFIEKSKKIHGDKYDYSISEYISGKNKLKIICPEHNIFEQIARHHLDGKGCKICSMNSKLTTEEFMNRAIKIHGNKYDYSKVDYVNSKIKVKIICEEHGVFEQRPDLHLSGSGCNRCSANFKLTTKSFVNKSKKIHGDKYDYSKVDYINSGVNVIITCEVHGDFSQNPRNHLKAKGCKKCKMSKGESRIEKYLIENKIKYKYEKSFDDCRSEATGSKFRFDFFLPVKNILIEYDGEQHYNDVAFFRKSENVKEADNFKNEYAKSKGLKLIRIPYFDFNKIEQVLEENI